MSRLPGLVLGFDYGTCRIGTAVGQLLTGSARPLEVVRVRNSHPDWERIGQIIAAWQPVELLVGLPLNMDGSEQPMTDQARRFARQVGGRYGLAVHLVDERLTTREARSRLPDRAGPGAEVDMLAAQIIVEDWLRSQRKP